MISVPRKLPGESLVSRCQWYVFVRWFILITIAASGMLSALTIGGYSNSKLAVDLAVSGFVLFSNVIFYFLAAQKNRAPRYYRALAAGFLAFDIIIITFFIYVKGGDESRLVILYVIPIILSATLFSVKAVYWTDLFAIACYDLLLIAVFIHLIKPMGEINPGMAEKGSYVFNTIIFFNVALLLISFVTNYINKLLHKEEQNALENLDGLKRAQAIAHLGSWEHDIKSQKYVWSDEMYRLFNRVPRRGPLDVVAMRKFVHPEDQKLMQKKAKIAMRRKYSFSMDIRITTPGRPMRYLHTDTQSLVNDKGEVYKIYGTMRDITESKRLDEAQSDFLALASHQLRTPATVVKQYLALIIEGYAGKLAQKQKEFVEKAYIGNERQIRIVNDMLRIANLDAGKIELNKSIVDMVDLMNDILKDYRANLDPEVHKIKFNTRHNEMLCNIDSEYIRMAVENIIDNAIKYTNREANITITLVKSKGKICLSIADKGLGMEKAEARKIFQKFYRIHNQYTIQAGGSGLGLYWVARVVAMHKGRVEVDSKLGRGSSFTLLLPASLPANYVA